MANEWIAKNFFSLNSDNRTPEEAVSRVIQNAEEHQSTYPDDFVYVIYLDIKRKRFGIVFSDKSFNQLKSWGLVTSSEQSSLMEFIPMINDGIGQYFIDNPINSNSVSTQQVEEMINTNNESNDFVTSEELDSRLLNLSDSDIQRIVEILSSNSEITDIPSSEDIKNDVINLLLLDISIEDIKSSLVEFYSSNQDISIESIIEETKAVLLENTTLQLDVDQAQHDIVSATVEFLTTGTVLDSIVNSAYISSFKSVVNNLSQKNAELITNFDNNGQLEITYND